MSTPAKLGAFAGALALLFGGGALAGGAIDPDRGGDESAETSAGMGGHGTEMKADPIRGLAVAENGLRLAVEQAELQRGRREELRFRILDAAGKPVTAFDVEHTKRMHVIVARRDLGTFQHLHPRMDADGTWTTPLKLDEAGSYRVFADFSHDGEATTLATDLRVDGAADLQPLPAPAATAKSDGGYDVALSRHGEEIEFAISRDGRPVQTEEYLGAGGHLVALREGDLAFLHVHPSEHAEGDAVAFETKLPTTGSYRLFLQFQHEGRVQTVAFTTEVK